MSRICQLTGKKPITGNHVSHSNHKTKRKFYPNLQKKRFYHAEEGKWYTLQVSTEAIRTISKHGLAGYLRKMKKKGKAVNIQK